MLATLDTTTPAATQAVGSAGRPLVVALAGSPNVGKTSVFNALTGLNQHVGNWPGKTVEQKQGAFLHAGRLVHVVDLPGAYSLNALSAEEEVARDYCLYEKPDVIVVVVSAAALERTLYLAAEFLELEAPVVVALNMVDVAEAHGVKVDAGALERALGVPVVPMVASRGQGLGDLMAAVADVADGRRPHAPNRPVFGPVLEGLVAEAEDLLAEAAGVPCARRWVALKLLEGDRQVTLRLQSSLPPQQWQALHAFLTRHEDGALAVAGARYEWIGRLVPAAVSRAQAGAVSLTERVDRVATHPIAGPLVLLGVLGTLFGLVALASQPLVDLLEAAVGGLADLVRVGLAGAPSWLVGLLADGLLGGVGAVLALLPILLLFFAAMAILEDVGYLARGAFVADGLMHRLGLHGKSFLPLFLGFGCNVPAVTGARILDAPRDRLLTALLAPLVPCIGRFGVLIFVTSALYGAAGPWVTLGLVCLSLLVLAASATLIGGRVLCGESPAFVMELPLYHTPNWRAVVLYTGQRLLDFLRRAGTIILGLSAVIWALATFPGGGIESSYLAAVGHRLAPLGALLGLDWRLMVALLASVVAKEQAIATLGVLAGTGEGGLAAALPGMLTPAAGLAFLVVQILFVPCIGTLSALRQETRSWRWVAFSVGYLGLVSFGTGIVLYQGARLLGVGV
ncbi:MAG: ferrous iron transport protein B [Anaerolineae bacterium]